MVSSGWTNPTPWHTYREESEDELKVRFEAMILQVKDIRNCIFNLHAPPYGSTLDEAPKLGKDMRPKYAGNMLVPVGSKSVRAVIDQHQPLLGLHGHIHESKGATRLGRTLCINPGSMYEQGYLAGAVIKLEKEKIKNYILTNG
jgi:Icc-related predicted phosphoesterase